MTELLQIKPLMLQCLSARLIRFVQCCLSEDMPPAGQGSGNRTSTPQAKGKAHLHANKTPLPKTRGTSLHKGPGSPLTKATPNTHSRPLPLEAAQLGRTRRSRGGTHIKRDGSSGFISSSVTTMFMSGPFSNSKAAITSWQTLCFNIESL